MRDVGALAGVSLKTVSRVVNRDPTVSVEIVSRVLRAVQLLEYRPNLAASSLRRSDRKTATIGLLLEDVANPFSSALHRVIEDEARRRGTLVFVGSSDEDSEREREVLAAFVSHQVDGLIVVPVDRRHANLLSERRRSGLPMVFVDRPAGVLDADSVTVDNRAGAALAVRHLAAHGHRAIAFLGDLHSIWTSAERQRGYLDGLASAGIRQDPRLVRQDIRSGEAAEEATLDVLASADPPTALFTGQNLVTIGAVRALRQRGLQRRVALLGFDDFQLADMLDPPVSVIAQDPAVLGRTAARLLFARLDGGDGPPQQVVLPTRLLARGSGEIPAP
jgi:LacI family transcriptional regulator